ncbi:MAG: beta-phosphoglucomutase [Adhaeribacter sp.]
MSAIKACLFDLDGVIVNTAVYHYKAWNRLAHELGFEFTEEQNENLKGVSRMRSLDLVLEWGEVIKGAEEKQTLADRKNTWYQEMISQMQPGELLPGAREFLQDVRAAGLKTAICSASKNTSLILQKVGLGSFFDAVVDGNQVAASKPDPEVFLLGAAALAVPPEACLVFEDAVAGLEAARAAGMKVIGIGSQEILAAADRVVSGLHELTAEDLQAF